MDNTEPPSNKQIAQKWTAISSPHGDADNCVTCGVRCTTRMNTRWGCEATSFERYRNSPLRRVASQCALTSLKATFILPTLSDAMAYIMAKLIDRIVQSMWPLYLASRRSVSKYNRALKWWHRNFFLLVSSVQNHFVLLFYGHARSRH